LTTVVIAFDPPRRIRRAQLFFRAAHPEVTVAMQRESRISCVEMGVWIVIVVNGDRCEVIYDAN